MNKELKLESLVGITATCSIRLHLRLKQGECRNMTGQLVPERNADIEVEINAHPIDCGAPWDLLALVASASTQGGYYLGNCGCGEPGCAGIWKPIDVRHEGVSITWTVPAPYVKAKGSTPVDGSLLLRFDAEQYRTQTDSLLAAFRKAAKDGGPLVRLICYPGELPQRLLDEAGKGWPGYGECTSLRGDGVIGRAV
jgi:hypothetical protein